MKISESTKRIQRAFSLAKKAALRSTYGNIKHGALLFSAGRVLQTSYNKINYSSFGMRFRGPYTGVATAHAEIGAVFGISRNLTGGADVFVARVGKNGSFKLSKPCDMCTQILKFVGIKRVFYTIQEDEFAILNLRKSDHVTKPILACG